MKSREQQKLEKAWNTFERTGSVGDYLDYTRMKRDILGEHADFEG